MRPSGTAAVFQNSSCIFKNGLQIFLYAQWMLWRNFLVYVADRYHNAFRPRDSLRDRAFCRNFKLGKLWKSSERDCFKRALNSITCARFLLLKAGLSMFYLLIPVHEW